MLRPRWHRRSGLDVVACAAVLAVGVGGASTSRAATPAGTPASVALPGIAVPGVDLLAWRHALAQVAPASLVRFPESQGANPSRVPVETALLTTASPQALLAVLLDPAAYCRAVKSLVRCEGGPTLPVPESQGTRWHRAVDWELEIPLSNLAGRLQIEPDADWTGVTLRFVSGDLAPGTLHVRWTSAQPATSATTLVWASLTANVREANWLLRRLTRRDPWTEPAIRGAIVWIAAQALAALAAHPEAPEGPRPSGLMGRPGELPLAVGGVGLAAWVGSSAGSATPGTWAAVENAPSGRLASVRVSRRWTRPAVEALHQIASLPVLRSFVGWNEVTTALSDASQAEIEVEDKIPFVDFTARWRLSFGPSLEAHALRGAIKGAQWSWSATSSVPSTVVFSSYPRLERSGWAPRRFIEAEPLLEHGLALALGYVNMMAAEQAVASRDSSP